MLKQLKLTAVIASIVLSHSALADNNGWYVSGKLGASFIRASDLYHETEVQSGSMVKEYADSKTKTGFNVGLQGGYNFAPRYNANVRLELDSTYRPEAKFNSTVRSIVYNESIKVKSTVYTNMVNAYFDIDTGGDFTPYLSAGIGLGSIDAKFTDEEGSSISETDHNFAWAVGAGISYSIDENLDLDLGYRYIDAGKVKITEGVYANDYAKISAKFATHDVTLGLRYSF